MKSIRRLLTLGLLAFGLMGCTSAECEGDPDIGHIEVKNNSNCVRLLAFTHESGSTFELQPGGTKKLPSRYHGKEMYIPKGNCGGNAKDEYYTVRLGDIIWIFSDGSTQQI